MSSLRIVFAGTPNFASFILEQITEHGYPPVAVYTQPDRPAGRGRKLLPSPVKERALELECPIEQPTSLKNKEAQERLRDYKPDLMIVVAYGLILPSEVLDIPTYGCINVHASLLPRWRGAAPIERAYMAGDDQTGICIMQMDEGLDTGPVFKRGELNIANKPIHLVEDELSKLGAEALIETIQSIEHAHDGQGDMPIPTPQTEEGANYAHKLTAADRSLDFDLSATILARQINALAERMPVRLTVGDKRAQLLEARALAHEDASTSPGTISNLEKTGLIIDTATSRLLITKLKFEGGKGTVLDGAALLNGYRSLLTPGARVH